MLWIALHLPRLSLETLAATVPPPAGDSPVAPLALLQGPRVGDVDDGAAALGVQPGMRRATALALAPGLRLGQADARRDARALAAVADVALACTPMVLLDTPPGTAREDRQAQGVLLEVQASLRYFGGHARLLQRLTEDLRPLGHQACIASAPTALGAGLLARWRSDLATGPHVTQLPALHALLDAAPLSLLGPSAEQALAMQGMGLATLGALRRLPRSGLARRFGPALLQTLDRARGEAPDPREPLQSAARFEQRLELHARADHHAQLQPGVQWLLAALAAWVRARQVSVVRFELRLHHERRRRVDDAPPPTVLSIEPARPSADALHLQSLLSERLSRLDWPAPVLNLSLHCADVVAGAVPSGELFPTREQADDGLLRLVERLQARLGEGGVQSLQLQADHRPERASTLVPARPAALQAAMQATLQATSGQAPASKPVRRGAAQPVCAYPLTRPVWRIEPPQPLGTARRAGPVLDGRVLRLLAGPERIEAGWWDGDLAQRDYFVAQAADGCLLWLYRLRQAPSVGGVDNGSWFLHGRFA